MSKLTKTLLGATLALSLNAQEPSECIQVDYTNPASNLRIRNAQYTFSPSTNNLNLLFPLQVKFNSNSYLLRQLSFEGMPIETLSLPIYLTPQSKITNSLEQLAGIRSTNLSGVDCYVLSIPGNHKYLSNSPSSLPMIVIPKEGTDSYLEDSKTLAIFNPHGFFIPQSESELEEKNKSAQKRALQSLMLRETLLAQEEKDVTPIKLHQK